MLHKREYSALTLKMPVSIKYIIAPSRVQVTSLSGLLLCPRKSSELAVKLSVGSLEFQPYRTIDVLTSEAT